MPTVIDLIERASSDPVFLAGLARDPLAAVQDSGYQVSSQELRELLELPEGTDAEMAEILQERLSYSLKDQPKHIDFSCNCSGVAGGGGGT